MSDNNPFFILAPLQGLTCRVFRDAFFRNFGGVSAALTPFISVPSKSSLSRIDKKELAVMEHYNVVPQVLSNSSDEILKCAKIVAKYGYSEINLNLGCPVKNVVSKKRGSALLAFPEELDAVFAEVFDNIDIKFSIKMRVGFENEKDFFRILPVLVRYPFASVTIHPRFRYQFYEGDIRFDLFNIAAETLSMPVIYNGSIDSRESFMKISEKVNTNFFMIGRGILRNPFLCEEILGLSESDNADSRFERILNFVNIFLDMADSFAESPFYAAGLFKELFYFLNENFHDGKMLYKSILSLKKSADVRKIIL